MSSFNSWRTALYIDLASSIAEGLPMANVASLVRNSFPWFYLYWSSFDAPIRALEHVAEEETVIMTLQPPTIIMSLE
jgi:hypothetical protein